MSFFSLLEIIKVVVPEPGIFFWIPLSIAEAAAVIPNWAKICFANATSTFNKRPVILLNNESKNPPNWIILDFCVVGSSINWIFSLNAFLSLVFCLGVNDNSWGKLFRLNILIFILKVAPVWFLTAVFGLFNRESDNLRFTLLYLTIYKFSLNFWCSFAMF